MRMIVRWMTAVMVGLAIAAGAVAQENTPHASEQALKTWWSAPKGVNKSSYNCPKAVGLPKDIVAFDFYTDAKHSIPDPTRMKAYADAERTFDLPMEAAEHAADAYQQSGKTSAAVCVVQLLKAVAASDAMTGTKASNQSYYLQNWVLGGMAVAYLKVMPAHAASNEDDALITGWMGKVGWQVEAYFEARRQKKTSDGQNNHLYWAGFAAMAAAIAANDHKLFDWGVQTYWDGVHNIQPDGTLPLEMGRGQKALHYHLFAVTPLVMMAELGEANGLPMYAANNQALQKLAVRCLAGLADNSYFRLKSGVEQDTPNNGKIKSDDIDWAVPYAKRFPDPRISGLINQVGVGFYTYIGGMPPG